MSRTRMFQVFIVVAVLSVLAPAYGDSGYQPYLAARDEPNAKLFLE